MKMIEKCENCTNRKKCGTGADACASYKKAFLIHDIEALTEDQVKALQHDMETVNGHEVYFVDFGGYFGFSALVFRSGSHLYYANDYELHHTGKTEKELKAWYLETMKTKLFSDDMIATHYNDYVMNDKKYYYLRNYYPQMCADKVSAFNIFHNESERADFEKSVKNMFYCREGFFYTADHAFIDRLRELFQIAADAEKGNENDYDFWFDAFKYEMFNHEYAINWQGDADVIGCFANVARVAWTEFYDVCGDLGKIFTLAGFSDIQKKAYTAARSYVLAHSEY